jgi:hypothetical protein
MNEIGGHGRNMTALQKFREYFVIAGGIYNLIVVFTVTQYHSNGMPEHFYISPFF